MSNYKQRIKLKWGGIVCALSMALCPPATAATAAQLSDDYVQYHPSATNFSLKQGSRAARILLSPTDWKGVIRAAKDLGADIGRVTGTDAQIDTTGVTPQAGDVVAGTLGKNHYIDSLAQCGAIDVKQVKGQWEAFVIQHVDGRLVIAGSDKRGTIYGLYDISEKIGVSPWYWWADVPAQHHDELYIAASTPYVQPSPKVKYRGIFINDEEPSFGGWTRTKFGGFNSKMYAHMFELLLRLKANYLWPAMWSSAFNEDDPLSPQVADEYGIVMGTSHHEPMMRAHKEYTRRRDEVGPWDYVTNKKGIDKFFKDGIERNKDFDNMITIGMRGDGDVAMGKGSDEENMQTLREVVEGQRRIISEVYKRPAQEYPQLWAIFTEVQRYYDAGLTVPDDVMLLFCDNNWGYIRRTGPEREKNRKGGMGLYYHIDMNGGPWNDRWVNTTTVPKLREQLGLAYETGIDRLWVINVGDLKPKEYPIDFIMRFAWDPMKYQPGTEHAYTLQWAKNIFGERYAGEVAYLVETYSQLNLQRKAEVQTTRIYSQVSHREAERMYKQWDEVEMRAMNLRKEIPSHLQDAFYQLVYYPVVASSGVAKIYLLSGKNELLAAQGNPQANAAAQEVLALFQRDKDLTEYYNSTAMAGGKWNGMMRDNHIGYTQWSIPRENKHPDVAFVEVLDEPSLGVSVEGSTVAWTEQHAQVELALPELTPIGQSSAYITLFNQGSGPLEFKASTSEPWLQVSTGKGEFSTETEIQVNVDWGKLNSSTAKGYVMLSAGKQHTQVSVTAVRGVIPTEFKEPYYGTSNGAEYSIPAIGWHANRPSSTASWRMLPGLGRGKGCMGISPVTAPSCNDYKQAPALEYNILVAKSQPTDLLLGVLPTQDVNPARGLYIAVGIDDEKPVVIDARKGFVDTFSEYNPANLKRSKVLKPLPSKNTKHKMVARGERVRNEVFDNLRWLDVTLPAVAPGVHRLKVYMVNPELVVERIVVNPCNERPSYNGAPSVEHNSRR